MSEVAAKSPRSKTPDSERSKSPRAKTPESDRPKSPKSVRVSADLAAENAQLREQLADISEVHENELSRRLSEEAGRALAAVEELRLVSSENEELKAALEAAESTAQLEFAARQRVESDFDVLCREVRSMEQAIESSCQRHDHAMAIQLAHAQQVAAAATQEATRLNQMLVALNRHTVGHPSHSHGGVRGHGRMLEPPVHQKRAAHYRQQASASYRSASPRFGKSHELAARGVRAGTNVALGEEQPMLPCPGAHHSNRDAKGNFWAAGAKTSTQFDLPAEGALTRRLSF